MSETIIVDYGEFKIKVKNFEISDLIVDWEGIELNGKPFPYSKENAVYLVNNFPNVIQNLICAAGLLNE